MCVIFNFQLKYKWDKQSLLKMNFYFIVNVSNTDQLEIDFDSGNGLYSSYTMGQEDWIWLPPRDQTLFVVILNEPDPM